MSVYESKYKDCPQVEKIIKKNGGKMTTVMTNQIKLEVKNNVQDVELTFRFPFCPNNEDEN